MSTKAIREALETLGQCPLYKDALAEVEAIERAARILDSKAQILAYSGLMADQEVVESAERVIYQISGQD